MLVKGIDLPEELLRAQSRGELVIFVGAGVSHPAPSSLPLFKNLAEMIGKDAGTPYSGNEPVDRYMGKLKLKGVKVHEAAASILINENTHPHELHRLLLQLFPSPDKARLVTTNFDTHFTTTGRELFKEHLEIFTAPALPLGDGFAGLIYLHGCADKNATTCVLTDEDFGRAYLTQAWASRFLAAMFSQYTVLFIGYSHDDPVMNYLARGLPPVGQQPRFAFTTDDTESLQKWEFLGIRPLVYKKTDGENQHQAITDSVREWVNEHQRGLLEKSPRIQAIVEAQPPLEGEDADYIKHILLELNTARLFFKYAKAPEWISWLEKNGFLKLIFDPTSTLERFHEELAFWVVETFLDEHSQSLLAAIERHQNRLNPRLCWFIWRRLAWRKNKAIPHEIFAIWVLVLLGQPRYALSADSWAILLQECAFPQEIDISILLFDQATRPRIALKKSWRFSGESEAVENTVDFELNPRHGTEEYWTVKIWTEHFVPNLPSYADGLEPIVIANLVASHKLMRLSRPANRRIDPFEAHRQSIRPHEQDTFPNVQDVLIDAARDILDHLIKTNPSHAAARMDQWFASDTPILRRLAIFGYAQRTDISPDAKLLWLEKNNLLFIYKADVFWLMERSYPKASLARRRIFLDFVMRGRTEIDELKIDDVTRAYEIFNIVVWLHRVTPDCDLVGEELRALKIAHPGFEERQYPELGHWSSGVHSINKAEGLKPEEIANKPAADFLDELLSWQPRHPMDRDRSGYCSAVSSIVSKKPEWGIEWSKVLIERKLTDKDLWYCVCQGWRNANLSPAQWKLVLNYAEIVEAPPECFSSLAEVLENGSRRETNVLPEELMPLAQKVAVRIWAKALAASGDDGNLFGDWLTTAINQPGGRIAEFWLQRISSARKAAGESWQGIPAAIADELRSMIHGASGASAHVRVIFASQLHYFFSLDHAFATSELLPLFDWQINEVRAEQCWTGFLFWGRWLTGLTDMLLPHFTETIKRNSRFSKSQREHLVQHVAVVSLFFIDDPLADEWLTGILLALSNDDRVAFAASVNRHLDATDAPIAENIWERWLSRYWSLRLLNTPKPLLPEEANEMACWSLGLGKYFPNAVALTVKMTGVASFEHTPILHYVHEKLHFAKSNPEAVADLVLFYLETPPSHFYSGTETAEVWQFLNNQGITAGKLKKIREALFRLGVDPGKSD